MSVTDDVKHRLDIVQLVSEYVSLQKSGRNFKALCPFHAEKTPSFFVFPERQSWHCFGACGTGGDVFSFVMKKEGLDFGQTLRLLAQKAGVTLVVPSGSQKQVDDKHREVLLRINEVTAEYYHYLLLNTSAGEIARAYVAGRGLSPQTVEDFQLGFAPEGWVTLRQYLMGKGYKQTDLVAAGLLVEREGGDTYDRFRNRLMFPIRDLEGNVQGFGARALDDSLPKYINSAQTLIFDKSRCLYGIDQARTAIRQDNLAIVTEGYMDVLTAHQHGWKNVVASMGTSLTQKQLAVLRKMASNLMLALDADAAGEEAVSRSGETVDKTYKVAQDYAWMKYDYAYNLEVKILALPRGKDPDEVISEDASEWRRLIADAKPMVNFILDTVVAKVDLEDAKAKSAAVEKLLPLLSNIEEPIRQAHYVQKLARLLKIDERAVEDALRRFRLVEKRRKANRSSQSYAPLVPVAPLSSPLEEYCLGLLLQFPELKSEGVRLLPDYLEHSENRELFLKWQQSDGLASLRSNVDGALHGYLDSLLAKAFLPTLLESEVARQQALNDCIVRLQERWLRSSEAKKEELLAMEAEAGGVTAQLTKLEEQGIEESKHLREVFVNRGRRRQATTRRSE